jgi:hypothetical protein
MTQVCSHCRVDKPASCYYADKSKKSGLTTYCKDCMRELKKASRRANPERYAAKIKRFRDKYPELHRAKARRQIETKPKARYAVDVVRNELKRDRLKRQPCEVCGEEYVHGHHDDYDQPLVVRWLCPVHHTEWHDANGPGANIEGEPVLIGRASRRSA